MANSLISLATGTWLMAIGWFFYLRGGSWLVPGAFIMGFWAILMLAVGVLTPDYVVTGMGAFAIFLACLAMALGSMLAPVKRTPCIQVYHREPKDGRVLLIACVTGSLLGIVAMAVYTIDAGFSLKSLFSMKDVFSLGHYYAHSRYSIPGYREPNLAIFLTSFVYWAAFCGGAYFALAGRWIQRMLSMICFMPAIGITLILTTRASFLFTAIIWLAGYLSVSAMLSEGRWRLLTKGRMIGATAAMIAAIGMYVVGFMFRAGSVGTSSAVSSVPQLVSAFLGSVPAFSAWISKAWDTWQPLGWGSSTLAGPIGLLIPIQRAHFNPIVVGQSAMHLSSTTVYTLFRQLIYDYSLPGAFVILILLGYIGGIAWRGALSRRWLGVATLAAFYLVAMTSFVGSPFAYTTITFGWILFALTLALERGLWIKSGD